MSNEIESKYYIMEDMLLFGFCWAICYETLTFVTIEKDDKCVTKSACDIYWQQLLSDYVADINNVSETEASLIELSEEFDQLLERGLNILEFSNKRRKYLSNKGASYAKS